MGGIMLLAAEFAALRAGTAFWFRTVYTSTVVMLLVATLAARFSHRAGRPFWFGFALFGWAYFLLVLGPWSQPPPDREEPIPAANSAMLSTPAIASTLHFVRGSAEEYEDVTEFATCSTNIAHLMIALIAAMIGGWTADFMRRRRTKRETTSSKWSSSRATLTGLFLLGALGLSLRVVIPYLQVRSESSYFPELVFGSDEKDHQFEADWYSQHLKAMNESSLWKRAHAREKPTVYRLLWLPSFDHPACLRITRSEQAVHLRTVVLDGWGGYDPGAIAIDKSTRLSDDRWTEFDGLLKRLKFWSQPTQDPGDVVTDGDRLILEACVAGKYHVITRQIPEGDYLNLCRVVGDYAGIELTKGLAKYHGELRGRKL
jgi:hypothetical protein